MSLYFCYAILMCRMYIVVQLHYELFGLSLVSRFQILGIWSDVLIAAILSLGLSFFTNFDFLCSQ